MFRSLSVSRWIAASVVAAALAATSLSGPVQAKAPVAAPAVESACSAPAPGAAQCLALRRIDLGSVAPSAITPQSAPSGFGPADLQSAYALPSLTAGSGMTVAVVDAYDLPTAEADLAAYRAQFGLPACTSASGCFRKVNQRGGTSYPAPDSGWGQEIALDIDMVSAICPNCKILLVEADSANYSDLGPAVNRAVTMGAIAVSNSYVGSETNFETDLDSYYDHPGVAITASTGDCGYLCTSGKFGPKTVGYPAASPHVIAVGGTSLVRNSSPRGWSESAWGNSYGGAGSGCSKYEPRPDWQPAGVCGGFRTEADVSAVADPATGVAIYYDGFWYVFGGTSASSPIIAATFALAGGPMPGKYPGEWLYSAPAGLNDAIGGNNDVTFHTCSQPILCNGVAGYDGPTGLGTPNGIGAFTPIPTTYTPISPVRLLDTRVGIGSSGAIAANTPRTWQVGGLDGIPSAATAVTGNLTVTNPSKGGAVYVGPSPNAHPPTSTINFALGQTIANGVTVALSNTGSLSATYMANSGNVTSLVFDVTGYFTADTTHGDTFHALTPARIVDSRTTVGLSQKLVANEPATFDVWLQGGVLVTAKAVTGNVTIVNPTSRGAVYVGPDPIAEPSTSTINFTAGQTIANNLTVALSGTGTLSATLMGATDNTTDLVFDVTGYYTADSSGSVFVPIVPVRLVDTRVANGIASALRAGVAQSFQANGRSVVPVSATGVSANATVVNETIRGALFVGPNPIANPPTSTLNFSKGDIRANGLNVATGSGGILAVTYLAAARNTTDFVFDVTGYFVPAAP